MPSIPSASKSSPRPSKAQRNSNQALQGRIYAIRVIFSGMALIILAVNDSLCKNDLGSHLWLLLLGAVYPHLGHLLFGRFDFRRRRGHVIYLIDGLFIGALIAALNLAPLPSTILATINFFNWMVIGGGTLTAMGSITMLAGFALTREATNSGITAATGTCSAPEWLASAVLIGYFLIVARVIHQLIEELRQQQTELLRTTDRAINAKSLAEKALISALPISMRESFAAKSEVSPIKLDEATVLHLEFEWDGRDGFAPPTINELSDTLAVCNTILKRHGFELIKTFGPRAIALNSTENGPDCGTAAALEIFNYFADHRSLTPAAETQRTAHICMHCGSLSLGLIQPDRLNPELIGEAINGLSALTAIKPSRPSNLLVVSNSAYRRLRNCAGLSCHQQGDGQHPSCYLMKFEAGA